MEFRTYLLVLIALIGAALPQWYTNDGTDFGFKYDFASIMHYLPR